MTSTIAIFQISSEEDLRFQLDFVGLALAGRTLRVNVRERTTNALKVSLVAPTNLTLAGNNLTVFYAKASMAAWTKGIEYEADIVDETGGTATRIMAVRFVYDDPGKLVYGVRGNQATVLWEGNQAVVTAIGGVGPPGPVNVITVGAVTTLETGEPATAALTGTSPTQSLNLGLPKGATGTAATVAVGTVTTVAPGTPADVTNSGTSSAAVLDFDIPAGAAATVGVGSTTTGAAGSSAAVANSGTTAAAVFDFTIPRGDKGNTGDPGTNGYNGWTPELAVVADGVRRVHQVVDWFGGGGTKPATGEYIGATGLVALIADANDIRGAAGTATIPDGDKGDITTSAGGDTWTIDNDAVTTAKIADAELKAIGGLTSAANTLPYFTGPGAADLASFTAWGRSLIGANDAAAGRAIIAAPALTDVDGFIDGLEISTDGLNGVTVSPGVCVADGMVMRIAAAMTKQINATWSAGTGGSIGCLDAGSEGAGEIYYLSVIGNPTTGAVDFIASENPAGPSLPSGFTARFDLPPVFNDGSSNLRPIVNIGDEVRFLAAPVLDYTNTSFGAGARTLVPLTVPALRCTVILNCHFYSGPSTAGAVWVTSPDNSDFGPVVTTGRATGYLAANASLQFSGVRVSTANGQVGVRFADGMSGGQVYIGTVGFIYPRGRHR